MAGSGSNINQITTPQPTPQPTIPIVFYDLLLPTPQPTPTIGFIYVQPVPVIALQTTPTKSLAQILQEAKQEAEDKKANSISQAIDYTNPTTRDFAVGLVKKSSSGSYNIAQICDNWEYSYNNWVYVNDPAGQDYYSPASRTINLGLKGDCDDFAILNAAVIQSIGGSSRVVTACAPNGGPCHAYAEVYLADTQSELQAAANEICSRYHCNMINYHTYSPPHGNTQYWLNLDWQAKYPGGPFFQDDGTIHIFYPNGYHFTSTD
jgi:transglutaminase-like putative cysteine protease